MRAAALLAALAVPWCGMAREYVAAPGGDDSGAGSASAPWRTLRHAFSRLAPGDTLCLRGGVYFESQIDVTGSGFSVRNCPGEAPVLDGGFREFRTAGNRDWEVHDAARGVYRSVKTYPAARAVYGYLGAENGGWRLATYSDYADLSADNEDYAEAPHYFGPGVFWDARDSRIYVRLKPDARYKVPADPDPRRTPLILFSALYLLRFGGGASGIRIEGIGLRYQNTATEFRPGAHHIAIARCRIAAGQYHVLIRGGAHDLTFDGIDDIDAFPPWVAWSDVKNWNRPGRRMQAAAFEIEAGYNIEIAHSTLRGGFDAIDAIHGPHHVRIHHNRFLNNRDDALEIGTSAYEFEVADNFMLCGVACVSRTGSGAAPRDKVGTKYIHHNVMDASGRVLFGRRDPAGLLAAKYHGPAGDGMNSGRVFGSHTMNAVTGPDPWKIYHNTIKDAPDMDNGGSGAAYTIAHQDPSRPQEVYNNIFIQTDDQWILRGVRAGGSQFFDGNLYFRGLPDARQPLYFEFVTAAGRRNFGSLKEWQRAMPGFEEHGCEGSPQLDSDYRPRPGGLAADGAIPLGEKGWPGIRGERHRGALPPAAEAPTSARRWRRVEWITNRRLIDNKRLPVQ